MTDSIFPEIDRLLNEGDYMLALEFIAEHGVMNNYRSMVDFLFCELHPRWKPACRKFYDEKGPALRDQITENEKREAQKRMMIALNIALEQLNEERIIGWGWYRRKIAQRFQQAA